MGLSYFLLKKLTRPKDYSRQSFAWDLGRSQILQGGGPKFFETSNGTYWDFRLAQTKSPQNLIQARKISKLVVYPLYLQKL